MPKRTWHYLQSTGFLPFIPCIPLRWTISSLSTPLRSNPFHIIAAAIPCHSTPFHTCKVSIFLTFILYLLPFFSFYWGEGSLPQSPTWGGKSMFDVCRGVICQLLLKVPCERLKPGAKLFQSSAVATFRSRASVASAIPASAAAAACFQCRCCCCCCFRGFLGVPGRCFCQRGCFFPASLLSPITSANLVLRIPGIPSSTRPQQEAQNLNNLIGSGFVDELS